VDARHKAGHDEGWCHMAGERIIAIDSSSVFMPGVFRLRHEVFVIEQAVPPELERDEYDDGATHLVALAGDEMIGTLRIVAAGDSAKVGRVAVRAAARKRGIGIRLMERAADIALQRGFRDLLLHAQLATVAFYRRLGYREEGDVFDEAGIAHVSMRKPLG
jgi:predicted GNAT family N-acyltransferase